MDLEDLRAAQSRERATDGLQDLRDSFYEDVADYIQSLKDARDERASEATDPFGDPQVQELTDEIETAEQVAEAIYERRMGKLVKQASLAAAGMEGDKNGLTQEEQALFEDLVARIKENKSHVLDVIAGEAEPVAPDATETAGGTDEPSAAASGSDAAGDSSAAAAMGGDLAASESESESAHESDRGRAEAAAVADDSGESPADEPPTSESDDDQQDADVDRTTVRITQDVGEILGVDERPYVLETDDVVTLPKENADPLVRQDAAEELSEQ